MINTRQLSNFIKSFFRRWDWLFVLGLSPLMIFPRPEISWILILYPVILGIQWWSWNEALPTTPVNPVILLMAIMMVVSIYVTPDLNSSLVKISGMLLGILIFFTVIRHSTKRQGLKASLVLFTMAGIGVAGLGLLAAAWMPSKFPIIDSFLQMLPVRLRGLPGAEAGINVNELGGALLWVVPMLLLTCLALLADPLWFARKRRTAKLQVGGFVAWLIFMGTALLFCTGVLIISQSRDAYLALALTIPIVLVLLARGRFRYFVIGLLIIGIFAGVIIIDHAGPEVMLNMMFANLPAKYLNFSINTMYGRVEIWSRAIFEIKNAPLTGIGMNIFRKAVYLQSPPFQDKSFDLGHAHNELLNAAVDLGLPGMVGLLALYFASAGMLVKAIRGKGAMRLVGIGIFSALFTHFLFGLPDAVALGAKPGFLFWWLLGLACGMFKLSRPVAKVQA